MTMKSIKTRTRLLTCLVVLAVVFATFLAGTFTSQASEDVFGDIELKVGDTLGFVYYTSQPYTENTIMRFTVNGRTSESRAYPNDGKCVFIFNDIYPHELAKEVTATIIVNGKETVSSEGLSIKSYLLQMLLDPNSTAAEYQFASDTLQYGEQTRLYRNANVDVADRDNVSITDDISTSIYKNYKPQNIDTNLVGHAQGLGVSASNIRLSAIGISYHNVNYFDITLSVPKGSSVNPQNLAVVIGDETEENTFTLAKSKTAYKDNQEHFFDNGDGTYTIRSYAINAYDLMQNKNTPKNTPIKLKVNGKVVQQASYNVMDYIYQLQDTTQSGSLALKYARSLYRYGQSATVAYKGNRVVSIALNDNPSNIVPGNKNAQTPTGGSITAYYSDGTSQVINEGITWLNKDIHGNEVKITDDTYEKSFTVMGSYTDSISGKTYTVTGTVLLRNSMTKIERYTDPSIYSPTSYAASYTPVNSVVKCTWNNGFVAYRTPTHSAINMADYKEDEYGFIPTTATYKDPKSGVTKTVTTYLLYKNPITAITVADTTANYNDGTLNNSTTPAASTYTVTYQNKHTTTAKSTSSSWTSTINDAGTNLSKTYSFAWTALTSNSTAISFTQTATGTLNKPAYGTWNRMVDGQNEAFSTTALTTTDTCTATVSNPEYQLTFPTAPSIYGGTVKTTNNLTGSKSSTTAGQWSGGQVVMRYYNNATEDVTANVTYSSPSITDTAYSKSVTVTAAYTKKNGTATTVTKSSVTIYNYLTGVSQYKNAQVYAASTLNTQLTLAATKNTLTATYANGKSETVGSGTDATTNIYLGTSSTLRNTTCWVESIATATVTTAQRTTAATKKDDDSRATIRIIYTDYRTGSNQTAELSGYKVTVINTFKEIDDNGNQRTNDVTMTSSANPPKPTDTVTVKLHNGKTIEAPAVYGQPTAITNNDEYQDKEISVSATAADGVTITGTVVCRVINPITQITAYTDPDNITVTSTSAITSGLCKNGQVTATYTNGKTKQHNVSSYTNLSNAKITNTTKSTRVTITANLSTSYSGTKTCDIHVVLCNPVTNASWAISGTGSSESSRLTLGTGSNTVSGTITYTYSNGQTSTESKSSSWTDTSTTNETGSKSLSVTASQSATTQNKLSAGTTSSVTATNAYSKSCSDTAYWKNNPSSCSVVSASCSVATYTSSTTTPSATVKVTYTNGASTNRTATKCDAVANITNSTYTASRSSKAYYTANGVTVNCAISVKLTNAITYYWCGNDINDTFSSTSKSFTLSGTAKFTNGYSTTWTADSLTINSAKWNGSNSTNYSTSGGTLTVNATNTAGKWVVSLTARVNSNGGRTDDITITCTNGIKSITAYTNTGRTTAAPTTSNYTSYTSESSYPIFTYNKGNTTSFTPSSLYFKAVYDTGSTWSINWDNTHMSCTSNPGHNVTYTYANSSNQFSASSTRNTTWQVEENGYTASTTFRCVPKSSAGATTSIYWKPTKAWYASSDRGNATRGNLGPADFKIAYSFKSSNTWTNGVVQELSGSSSGTQASDSGPNWGWGYNTYDTCGLSSATGYRAAKYAYDTYTSYMSYSGQRGLMFDVANYKYGSHASKDLMNDTLKNGYEYWIKMPIVATHYSMKRTGYFIFNWERCNYGPSSVEGTTIIWLSDTTGSSSAKNYSTSSWCPMAD